MADFDLFENLVTAQSEDRIRRAANERALQEAAFAVRAQFGAYLANAESTEDYDERFAYLADNISTLASERVEPTREVMAWFKQEFLPESLSEQQTENKTEKHGKLARRGDDRSAPKTATQGKQPRDPRTVVGGIDWQWDNESNSFKSTKSSNFQCVCGSAVQGVGQHECHCGRLWNLSSIVDGNKTAATPTYVCREVMRRDVHLANTNTNIKKADSDSDNGWNHECCDKCTGPGCGCCANCEKPSDKGYDVGGLIGPAAGEDEHDAHLSALDLIFAAEDDQENSSANDTSADDNAGSADDSAGDVSAAMDDEPDEFIEPQQNNPLPPPVPGPNLMNGDPAGMENQPVEDAEIQQAQQAILDMILREKSEEVTNDENNCDEIENLNDAYQSLDVVQDIENAEMMNSVAPMGAPPAAAQLATYNAGAKYGYILGYLEALADSYNDRKTDFEGFQPPIPGISNGLDDADVGHPKETDTTDELRELLKNQFDEDNGANKDQKPLDPAKPFGPDKGKSSRFRAR